MSALNIYLDGRAAHIVTDAAAAGGGVLFGLVNKTVILPHMGVALSFRGKVGGFDALKFALSNFDDHNALLEGLPKLLKGFYRIRRKLMPKAFTLEVGVVGYADGRPFAYVIATCDRPDAPAYTLLKVPFLWSSPIIDVDELQRQAEVMPHDLDGAMTSILGKQRKSLDCYVGGYGQITTVNAKGIHTRLLCKWPDKIARRIDRNASAVPVVGQRAVGASISGGYRDA